MQKYITLQAAANAAPCDRPVIGVQNFREYPIARLMTAYWLVFAYWFAYRPPIAWCSMRLCLLCYSVNVQRPPLASCSCPCGAPRMSLKIAAPGARRLTV